MYIEILKSVHAIFKILLGWILKVSKYISNNAVLISKKVIVNI